MGGATARARPRTRSDHAGARGHLRRAAGPIARAAHGGAELSAARHRGRDGPLTSPPARPRPQGRQASEYPGEPHDRRGQAHRFRYRLASAARAAGARAARVDCWHARLYGARTNRANEPLDRRPQRPLRPRSHALPDAHGLTAVYRSRSHGVGPLPYSQKAGAAKRAAGDYPGSGLRPYPEAARQERRGALSDRRRSRARPAALLGPIEALGRHRRLPVRPARHARPAADPREAVRESARGRDLARRVRPCRRKRPARASAGLRLFRHRQVRRRQ